MVEGAVEQPAIAGGLLGAEQALEAGVRLGDLVVRAKIWATNYNFLYNKTHSQYTLAHVFDCLRLVASNPF